MSSAKWRLFGLGLNELSEIHDDLRQRFIIFTVNPPNPKTCFSPRLAVVFAKCIEASCKVENENVVVTAPTRDAPTTTQWAEFSCLLKSFLYFDLTALFLDVK